MGSNVEDLWKDYNNGGGLPTPEEHSEAMEADRREFLATHPEIVEDHNLTPVDVVINVAIWGSAIALVVAIVSLLGSLII